MLPGYWLNGKQLINRSETKLAPLDPNRIAWTTILYYSHSEQDWVIGAIRINMGDVDRVNECETKAECLRIAKILHPRILLAAEDETTGLLIAVDDSNPNGTPPFYLVRPVKRFQPESTIQAETSNLVIVPLV